MKESLSEAEKWSKINVRKFGGSPEIASIRNDGHLLRRCFGLKKKEKSLEL